MRAMVFFGLFYFAWPTVSSAGSDVGFIYTGGTPIGGSVSRTIGVEFVPNINLTLESLGFYDAAERAHPESPVGIWRVSDQQLLATVTIPVPSIFARTVLA